MKDLWKSDKKKKKTKKTKEKKGGLLTRKVKKSGTKKV